MNVEEFRKHGKAMIDYICEYVEGVDERAVYPDVKPGFLQDLMPTEAPTQPEDWNTIMKEAHEMIMPGVTHWQHSSFHAYFPYGASFPSLLGEIMSAAIGSNSFSWTASPSCTELEIIVMDWLCKAMDLPAHFLSGSAGGGVLTTSASEAILNCMLAARERGINQLKHPNSDLPDSYYLSNLIAYCSEESHSSIQKAAKICLLRLRPLPTDENCVLRGDTLRIAMEKDEADGLLPIFVSVTLGSTSTAAFDDLETIGPVCKEFGVWFHVDAAYAGSSFICPEMRKYKKGLEYADSFNMNPYKWMLTGADCACLWVKNKLSYCSSLIVDPLYLEAGNTDLSMDLRHWSIPLTRKFRSLKLWFVIRKYGLSGLQKYQRNHMTLAKYFESLVKEDSRFEVVNNVCTGLVCFRLQTSDSLNKQLLAAVNNERKIHLTPTVVKNKYLIRFCVNAEHACQDNIDRAWTEINRCASKILCGTQASHGGPPRKPPSQLLRPLVLPRSISLDHCRHLTTIALNLPLAPKYTACLKSRRDLVVTS